MIFSYQEKTKKTSANIFRNTCVCVQQTKDDPQNLNDFEEKARYTQYFNITSFYLQR